MINKLYEKVKKFIKQNYKEVIFLIALIILVRFPLNYTIMVSGGTISIDDRIQIENAYKSKGSFNLAYVSEINATIPSVLLSYIIPSWTRIPLEEYQANKNETSEDILNRSKVYLEYSKQAAIRNAYLKAGKVFEVKGNNFYIVYISEQAKTNIELGDILKEVNGTKINSLEEYKKIIDNSEYGDILKLKVQRKNELIDAEIEVKEIDKEKLTGITVLQLYDYSVNPGINLTFKNNESGSSGGLMLTLSIYDKLVEEDLTKGLKIVGTGTIDFDGVVGEIDGIEYKLKGAVKEKADVFIAPSGENYNKCVELKNKNKYRIKIIEAKTFDDVLNKLKEIK